MALVNPPTPEEFWEHMNKIRMKWINVNRNDPEEVHIEMDTYILDVLESLGYKDGVDVFRTTPKWYA